MSEQAVFDALKYRVVVNEYGDKLYYNNANQLHRTDGPAIEWSDGEEGWWLKGVRYSEQEFHEQLKSLGHTPCPLM